VQGTRDEFGSREEVAHYELSSQIDLLWLEDGDHDLKPRKSVSGFTAADHLTRMARGAADWMRTRLVAGRPAH
jgi:predicted alpha/beta-hydrolase family hydrolase